ncbi:hypothetical protein M422DRAFT_259894 [Sphaerobolus stellatus SS14]|uniref:Uncharacterized protein n=1 Tax=Sphaerobolus stellatus (strain SS14) TaxID=990650 RepID=A0A0C9VJI6_SPHS4|nr:hypothetical protein M422DRAFT_259894 [Sphaerobolus stellatus SS14]
MSSGTATLRGIGKKAERSRGGHKGGRGSHVRDSSETENFEVEYVKRGKTKVMENSRGSRESGGGIEGEEDEEEEAVKPRKRRQKAVESDFEDETSPAKQSKSKCTVSKKKAESAKPTASKKKAKPAKPIVSKEKAKPAKKPGPKKNTNMRSPGKAAVPQDSLDTWISLEYLHLEQMKEVKESKARIGLLEQQKNANFLQGFKDTMELIEGGHLPVDYSWEQPKPVSTPQATPCPLGQFKPVFIPFPHYWQGSVDDEVKLPVEDGELQTGATDITSDGDAGELVDAVIL